MSVRLSWLLPLLAASLLAAAPHHAHAQEPALQVDWLQSPINGHWYGADYSFRSWIDAEALGVSLGGHLTTIRSQAEQDWIEASLGPYISSNGLWIGYNDVTVEGTFTWSSGESPVYENWATGQPDNSGGEDFGGLFGSGAPFAWKWNDYKSITNLNPLLELAAAPTTGWSWPSATDTGSQPQYGALADLDGDGDLDYASPDSLSSQVSIHWNDGNGHFQPGPLLTIAQIPITIIAVDHDQDGDMDLIVTCFDGQKIILFENSLGAFSEGPSIDTGSYFHGLSTGDFNQDGISDLVASTTSPGINSIRTYLGQVGGGFSAPISVPGWVGSSPHYVSTCDFNGDNLQDVVVAVDQSNRVDILFGDGVGGLSVHMSFSVSRPFRTAPTDTDQDGDLDLAVPALGSNRLEIWTNDGLGNFALHATYPAGGGPHGSAAADFNGDGWPDIAVPSYASDDVRVFWNDGAGNYPTHEVFSGHDYAWHVLAGDINGDSIPDLLTAHRLVANFTTWINNSLVDCNGNGAQDADDIASGTSLDCDGNGVPDECDLLQPGADVNGNGVLDVCEPALVAVTPGVAPSALGALVDLSLPNVPDGPADFVLGSMVLPVSVVAETAQVVIPALGAAASSDVIEDGFVQWMGSGGLEQTAPLPGAFTWDVPVLVSVMPNAVPFDVGSAVVIELGENVLSSGFGQVTFGTAAPMSATAFQTAGLTYVATTAPAQAAPGDFAIEVEIHSGGVVEYTRIESGAFVYLGPGITGMSAIAGFQGGGELVSFGLVDFQPGVAVSVDFGSAQTSGTPVGFLAASSLDVITPLSSVAGIVDVVLTQDLGGGVVKTVTSPSAWEFLPPTLAGLSASSGPQAGGEALVATSDGFAAGLIDVTLGSVTVVGSVAGSGSGQTISFTTPAAVAAGPSDVRFVQGVFDVTLAAGYDFLAPSLASVSPAAGAWYDAQTLTVHGLNFAPGVAVEVALGTELPMGGTVVDASTVTVDLVAEFLTGAGPLDVTLTQAGVPAVLVGGWNSLPALGVVVSGDVTVGGVVDADVQSQNGGVAYLILGAGVLPSPIPIGDMHYGLGLDPVGAQIIATAALLVSTPTASLPFPAGLAPAGTGLALQVFTFEAGAMGIKYSFTNAVPFVLP